MKINNNRNYTNEIFSELEFHDDRVEKSEFEDCKFINCNFSESQFVKCKFIGCEFRSSNLNLIKPHNSRFFETDFKDCKITGVNWTSLDWAGFSISMNAKGNVVAIGESGFDSNGIQRGRTNFVHWGY